MSRGPSSDGPDPPPSDEASEEAAAWFARMHSDQVTSEDEIAFSEWLEADPRRHAAYEEAAGVWSDIGNLRGQPRMRDLLQHLSPKVSGRRSRRGFLLWGGGGIAAAAVAGLIGWRYLQAPQTYTTAFGQQLRVPLADGSTLTLNTESTVRVSLTEDERRIWLDRGQAHFIVAPDANRPFRVFVGDEEVRALGTRFEVRREGAAMRVTLEEGSVAIFREGQTQQLNAPPTSAAQAVLSPGQQATVAAENINIAAVDTQRVLAWRFGQMNLDAQPLSEAIAEINRYNTRQIVLEDPSLGDMPISGLFQTGSPDAFVDAVSLLLPVEASEQADGSIRLRDTRGP